MDLFELINVHIIDWFNKLPERPLIVGLSGPQGCGKTTIVNRLSNDPRVISFSLDDFYYGHEDMMAVANANPDNPFLKFRGCPGTHDLRLLNEVLQKLVSGTKTCIPKYDKSAFNGRGDRCPQSTWKIVDFKPQIVIMEGWCLGFQQTDHHINDNNLRIINQNLKSYSTINHFFHAFVHLVAQDINFVYDWRFDQEEMMRKTKEDISAGLNREELNDFIDRFIPVYSIGVPRLSEGLFPNIPNRQLEILLNHDRQIISYKDI